jgi:NADH dehydrogenase/NADH:ubiquinone oxidoreductase subunit G
MRYTFDYEGTQYTTENPKQIEQFVLDWVETNWSKFVEYANNKIGYITKQNYNDVLESFYEDTISEVQN